MTKPVTPLLYISHNKSELLELRKHVFIKDAHEGKAGCYCVLYQRRFLVCEPVFFLC